MTRRRSTKSQIYRALRTWNDVDAVEHAVEHRDSRYITRRIGRRVYGRLSSRLMRALFPPVRRRR